MGSQFKLSIVFPILFLVLVASPARAADNGSGSSGNPQTQFCNGLYQSCMISCNAIDAGTLAGGVAKRNCKAGCINANLACWASAKKTGTVLKKKLP